MGNHFIYNKRLSINFIYSFCFLLVSISVLSIDIKGSMVFQYSYYAVLAIVTYSWIVFSNKLYINNKINLFLIYTLLTLPFYFGGQVLVLLGFESRLASELYSLVDGRVPMSCNVEAMKYIIISLQVLNLGYQFILKEYKKDTLLKEKITRETLNRISNVVIILTIFPTIARLGYDIVNARVYGHLAAFNARSEEEYLGIWYVLSYLKGWFLPACYMKLISCKEKSRIIVKALLLMYCVLYLLSGSRYEIVQVIFTIFIIEFYVNNSHKMKINKLLKAALLTLFCIIILRSVSYTRDATGSGLSLESIINVLGGGVLYESLFETSTTFTSLSNLLLYCPTTLSYNYGQSYLGGMLYTLPAFLRPEYMNNITLHISSVLSPYYYGFIGAGYGSSFLTEAYFNFGYCSYILIFGFGILLRKITDKISFSEKESCVGIVIAVCLMSELLWIIRSDTYLVLRHLVYYTILPIYIGNYFIKQVAPSRIEQQ